MSISATVIALFIFIAVIVGYVIHNKKRNPEEKLPLSDDVQKMYYDKYEQEIKNQDNQYSIFRTKGTTDKVSLSYLITYAKR